MLKRIFAALVATACFSAAPAMAQEEPKPQPVLVLNNARFEPLGQDVVVPTGQSSRFEARSGGFARVSLLIAGATAPGSGPIKVATVYGPPFVPSGPPRRLQVDSQGNARGLVTEPVLGPALVVIIQNDSSADVTLSLSAYFAN